MSFRRIALIGKPRGAESESSLQQLREFLRKRGCEVLPEVTKRASKADLAIVIGGDGTMLAAARDLVRHHVPLVGINQGRLGFMTDIGLQDMQSGIGAILDGKLRDRGALAARRGNHARRQVDAAHHRAQRSGDRQGLAGPADRVRAARRRRIRLPPARRRHHRRRRPPGRRRTRSRRRARSCIPTVPALTLVPLNPHTLSARPVSVSDRCRIEIVMVHSIDARAHFDGLALHDMAEGDRLILKRSADAVRFVHPPGYHYFATLREKLGWSEAMEKRRATD
jgi:NAD+ kinase